MAKVSTAIGIEINPGLIGVLFTEKVEDTARFFCCYRNGETSQFDMPAGENQENLRSLFASLNMEPTCTSLLLDEMVQGRVFIQSGGKHHLYTLLKSAGDTLPPLNADIGSLPWEVIWKSQEVEVLELGCPGMGEYCIAIRNEINELDAGRLMHSSKAFVNPVSIPRKQPRNWMPAFIAFALLASGFIIGAATHSAFGSVPGPAQPTIVAAQPEPSPASTTAQCFLLSDHRITGPFPAGVVAQMNAAGVLGTETLCRMENSTDWVKPSEMTLARSTK